jgi:hypothetical protein
MSSKTLAEVLETLLISALFSGVRGRGVLRSSLAGFWIRPLNTPPRWPWDGLSTLEAVGVI